MSESWRRFRKDKVIVAGAAVIVAVSLAAVFAPFIVPYDPFEQFVRDRYRVWWSIR